MGIKFLGPRRTNDATNEFGFKETFTPNYQSLWNKALGQINKEMRLEEKSEKSKVQRLESQIKKHKSNISKLDSKNKARKKKLDQWHSRQRNLEKKNK